MKFAIPSAVARLCAVLAFALLCAPADCRTIVGRGRSPLVSVAKLPHRAAASSSSDGVAVTVTVIYPDSNLPAGAVLGLRGSDPLSWDASWGLDKVDINTWQTDFTVLGLNASAAEWTLAMKIIVNDQTWQRGANDRLALNYNVSRSVMFSMYPWFEQTTGEQLTMKDVFSPQLNNTRDVWLYVPPGLVENPLRHERHTLIMHDGQNLAPPGSMGDWHVPSTVDALIDAGEMESVFIVGPYNTGTNRINEYTYSADPNYGGGEGDLYLDFLEQTLLPLVRANFTTIAVDQAGLGIMGSSLGGLISCYAGVTRPAVYSKIGCMSSSFWWNYGDFESTIVPRLTKANALTQQYYFDSGDSGDMDDDYYETGAVSTSFAAASGLGFRLGKNLFWYLERGGQHNEIFWAKRLHHPLRWLYFRPAMMNDPAPPQ